MKYSRLGTTLIALGVLAWPIGLWLLKLPAVPHVLTVHLSLVLPGTYFKRKK
ncbi:MAG: hypothetical protein ACE5GD_07000 [Candidatus Geothermarchaeales archaeon]